MSQLENVVCFDCQCHICWMTYCGPTGLHYCDACAENQERINEDLNKQPGGEV